MRRMRRTATVTIAVATLCAIGAIVPEPTAASWTDTEQASGSLTSGTVQPVTGLRCTGSGIAQPVSLTWSAPTAGLTVTGYSWTVTGGLNSSGTLAATATTLSLSSGLLGVGTGTFSLRAQGPGGWQSVPRTATIGFTTGLISSCSVP